MEDLYQKIRAIRLVISLPHHLNVLLETATILPTVQSKFVLAPGVYQERSCDTVEKGILLEAWGPLVRESCLMPREVKEIAAVTIGLPDSLSLELSRRIFTTSKSVTASRIQANLDCFGIELSHEERETLKAIAVQSGAPRVDDMDF